MKPGLFGVAACGTRVVVMGKAVRLCATACGSSGVEPARGAVLAMQNRSCAAGGVGDRADMLAAASAEVGTEVTALTSGVAAESIRVENTW